MPRKQKKPQERSNPITAEEKLNVEQTELKNLIINWNDQEELKRRFEIEMC